MDIGRSKTGKPTMAESGGGMTNTGYATIICGHNGQQLKPIFIPRGYSNGEHAIFIVVPGKTCFIDAGKSRSGDYASVYRITKISEDDTTDIETVGEYENGDGNIPKNFQSAVDAALAKANCYHCREMHYGLT